MNKLILLFHFFVFFNLFSQINDPLFNDFLSNDKLNENLLPDKMLFTQKILWGKKGLFRITNLSNLNINSRKKELNVRRKMLNAHQVIGYLTLIGMIAQGYIGGKLYNGDRSLYGIHKKMGKTVTISYFTGAGLSLFFFPPLIRGNSKGFSSIKIHKYLATIHFSAMLATNFLSDKNKSMHKVAAYSAFTSFALAVIVFKF